MSKFKRVQWSRAGERGRMWALWGNGGPNEGPWLFFLVKWAAIKAENSIL